MVMDFLVPSKPSSGSQGTQPWKILLVDDDSDVHDVTEIALAGVLFEERKFHLFHARSAEEAQHLLRSEDDIALALVDVVMENDSAGLDLVTWIRNELGDQLIRLVLKTGQPGYAPQSDVIMKFDIDGYAEKAELSRTKLISTIVTALRGYKLLKSLAGKRRQLEMMNTQFAAMLQRELPEEFAQSALFLLAELAGRTLDGILIGCDTSPGTSSNRYKTAKVLAASKPFEIANHTTLEQIEDNAIRDTIIECFETRSAAYAFSGQAFPLLTRNGLTGALFLGGSRERLEQDLESDVFQLFLSNIALGYEKNDLLQHVRTLAYVDPLTELSTRSGFDEAVARHKACSNPLLVAQIDVERFAVIVDGLGEEKAGLVLQQVGKRLKETFQEALSVARKEKDEFLVLFSDSAEPEIEAIVNRLEKTFQEPVSVCHGDFKITLRLRAGFAWTGEGGVEPDQLIRSASIALNDVRQNKLASFGLFHADMQEAALERLRLASFLSNSVDETDVSIKYQPIMCAQGGKVASIEALMRFRTHAGVLMNTSNVIKATEASGLIVDLGAWMFKEACEEISKLGGLREDTMLNVNLSPRQVQSSRIYRDIEIAADEADLPLARLVFEVTEGLFVDNDRVTIALLSWLRGQGAKVVIDDFGTGYSSFSYLRKLPVDGIKIDRSFIMNMEQDPDALAVIKSIVAVAQALDLSVTAEGVETSGQRRLIQEMKCDYIQGFYYAAPMTRDELAQFVARN